MTESQWLNYNHPAPMLEYIRDKVPETRLRLWCLELWVISHNLHYRELDWYQSNIWERYFSRCNLDNELRDRNEFSHTIYENWQQAADLVREIVGNPWRPVDFDKRWASPEAVSLAKAIQAENDFDLMPIMADTLEEAGCDSKDVLQHCRGQGICTNCAGSGRVRYPDLEDEEADYTCPDCHGTGWVVMRGPHVRSCWVLDFISPYKGS